MYVNKYVKAEYTPKLFSNCLHNAMKSPSHMQMADVDDSEALIRPLNWQRLWPNTNVSGRRVSSERERERGRERERERESEKETNTHTHINNKCIYIHTYVCMYVCMYVCV